MSIIQKKICMIGDFSVGKTSLVARFVRQTFSDKYLTTVGVKIDTKQVKISDEREVKFILWDIAGTNALSVTTISYLRGAAGYLLVVDGTRRPTWDSAVSLQKAVTEQLGNKPFILLLNKVDLKEQWEVEQSSIEARGWKVLLTSAKTGVGVEEAFLELAIRLI